MRSGSTGTGPTIRFYDGSLLLALSLNNNSLIGENSTYAVDNSKYGHNGTFGSGVADQMPVWSSSGLFGAHAAFDGQDDHVAFGDVGLGSTDNLT